MSLDLAFGLLLSFVPAFIGVKYGPKLGGSIAVGMILFFFLDFMELAFQLGVETLNPFLQIGLVLCFTAGMMIPQKLKIDGYWAYALAAHSMAEGIIIGLSPAPLITLVFQGASFVIHKAFEGVTVGVLTKKNPLMMGALISLPAIIGFFVPMNILVPYLFAFTSGAAIYALSKIKDWDTAKVLTGFLLVYIAGILHQVG